MSSAQHADQQQLETVDQVNLEKYLGKWYEIASIPVSFQKNCTCTTAEYKKVPGKKYIRVINRCKDTRKENRYRKARGKAFVVPDSGNSKLKVQFFWPFKGDYWIIDLADDYSYAVVGNPSFKYLWILSRSPEMDELLYQQIISRAENKGYDTTLLKKTSQACYID